MEEYKNILVLYSGGLDSYIMYQMACAEVGAENVTAIFFKHGQDSEQAELDVLPDFVTVRGLEWLDNNVVAQSKLSDPFAGAIYIPGRNLVFCVTAASQFLPDEIWMGTVVDEDNPAATDKNETFRKSTEDILEYVLSPFTGRIKIRFPFVEQKMTKYDSVKWALANGVAKEDIARTTSCWHNKDGVACGECKQCLKRFLVFALNGIEERYHVYPLRSEKQREIILEYLQTYVDPNYETNADEENMVKMIIRYFCDLYPICKSNEFYPWEKNVLRLIKQILDGVK